MLRLKSKWPFISTLVVLTLVGLFLGFTPPAAYAATCTSEATGNWNDTATWNVACNGNTVPVAGDDVVIGANTVTLNVTSVTVNNITIDGTLNAGANTINVKGNWTKNQTFGAGTGTVNFNGAGAQSIGGAFGTTFNIMNIPATTARTVTFGKEIRLLAPSTWGGTSCTALLRIRSSAPGTSPGTPLDSVIDANNLTANFVDVQDSKASAAVTVAQGINSGGNTNWHITACGAAVGGVAEMITVPTASTNGLGYLAGLAGVVMLVGAGWLVSKR